MGNYSSFQHEDYELLKLKIIEQEAIINSQKKEISFLRNLIQKLPGSVYWKSIDGVYLGCNDLMLEMAGIKKIDELIGKTDFELCWKDFAPTIRIIDQQVLKTGNSIEFEEEILSGNDQQITLLTRKTLLRNDQGTIVGILGISLDITDKIRIENEIHDKEIFIEDVLYNLPGLIYWKNRQSQYMGFNKNVVQLSGLSRKELLGKTDLELNWGQDEAKSFQKDDQEVIDKGVIKVTEHQIPIKRLEGNYMVVRTEKSRLFDRQGNIVGVLGVAMDITDQKMLELKLIAEKEKVEQLNQVKTQFIQNMEHDIRTPFSGVYSLTKILEKKETDNEKKYFLSAIEQCAKELLDYCNGILDFSKLELGILPLLSKKFDMKILIQKIINMEMAAALNKNLKLSLEYPENIPTFFISDQYRTQRILINLVSNAIKFTDKGYVKVRVELAKQANDKLCILQIFVEDSGIGIPKEKQSIIYERFNRLNPSNQGKYKGAGLGLTIVKCLIEELDGEIDVNSNPGQGTTFICTLPLKIPLLDNLFFEEKKDE